MDAECEGIAGNVWQTSIGRGLEGWTVGPRQQELVPEDEPISIVAYDADGHDDTLSTLSSR